MSEASPVELFAPWACDEERALRVRIHRARDVAMLRMKRSRHSQARILFSVAAHVASEWCFRRAPMEDLQEIIAGLTRLFLTAGMIERIEAPDE